MHFFAISFLNSVWRFCFVTSLLADCLISKVVLSWGAMFTERKVPWEREKDLMEMECREAARKDSFNTDLY